MYTSDKYYLTNDNTTIVIHDDSSHERYHVEVSIPEKAPRSQRIAQKLMRFGVIYEENDLVGLKKNSHCKVW